ncbi:MAG: S8 family peptidase [Planctomycetota bacterium]
MTTSHASRWLLMTLGCLASFIAGAAPLTAQSLVASDEYVPDQVIVRIDNAPPEQVAEIGALVGATASKRLFRRDIWRLELPPGSDVRATARRLETLDDVKYAHPNMILHAAGFPNDPSFSLQWGFHQGSDADIDAPEAWDLHTDASPVIVAVIDTGIQWDHPDLAANLWTNADEVPGNGIDDDANGYVDDVHGYDWVNGDADPFDDNSHGTHCAGTVGAHTNNGLGVAGTCWRVQLMALKFLSAGGSGTIEDAILAVEYSMMNGAHLSSNSYGCYCSYSDMQGLYDAVDAAGDAGMLFVAAAGNDNVNNDVWFFYPSSFDLPEVLAVAASDPSDNKAWFSNFGPTTVDIAAPGQDIYSTVPGNSYGYKSGTSMACPHVAGAVALVSSYCPELPLVEVKQILMDSVDLLPSFSGLIVSNGRLNLRRALDECPLPVTIEVLDPDGGELIYADSYTILWGWSDPSGRIDHVAIRLQDGGGNDIGLIDGSETNDGHYAWDASGLADGSYRIRIDAIDAYSNVLASDNSDASFRIDRSTSVAVGGPNGGELFYATHDITWLASDPDGEIDHVRLVLQDATGTDLFTIADGEPNDGVYSWDTTTVADGSYRIRIEALNASYQVLGEDASDDSFRVDHSTVALVLAPNGGEAIEEATTISWSATDPDLEIATIDLWLQDRNGNDINPISTGETNDGSYLWGVTGVPLGSYRIAVIARNGVGQILDRDSSDGPFKVGLWHFHVRR